MVFAGGTSYVTDITEAATLNKTGNSYTARVLLQLVVSPHQAVSQLPNTHGIEKFIL